MRLISVGVSAMALCSAPLAAQESQLQAAGPWLWAVPALYGFEGGVCEAGGAAEASTVVDPLFCPLLGIDARKRIGGSFARAVASRFANVEQNFGGHLPVEATASARLRNTLAVSLRLTRTSHTTVRKPVGLDAYLPVTLTLDITNPATGEVVFTRTRSAVGQGTYAEATLESELLRQFPSLLENNMQALVADAAAAFRPYTLTARVIGSISLGKDGTGFVVDKGRNAGLRAGDGINGDGTVVYSGPDYAVIRTDLAKYREGQQLSRIATAPVETLARPTVLTVMEGAPQGYSSAWLGQILEDALGSGSALAPVPVNAAFSALRTIALDGASANLAPDERSLPDYVASARVMLLDPVIRPTEIPGVTMERHEALAFVTLVDGSGRVVGSWQGRGLIEDKISDDIRLPLSQRRDAVLRNALTDAALKMNAFRPQPRFLPVQAKDGAFIVDDAAGAAPLGETLQVLRSSGRFPGIAGQVMTPIGKISTRELTAGGVLAINADPGPLYLRGGEVVALESSGAPSTMRLSVEQCALANGSVAVDDRGSQAMTTFAAAAPSILAGKMAAPVRLSTLSNNLRRFGPSFSTWQSFGAAQPRTVGACFVPVIAVVPEGGQYQITVGYTLHQGALASGTKIGSSGRTVKLTPSKLPSGTGAADIAAMLQSDLASQVLPIAAIAAGSLKPAS